VPDVPYRYGKKWEDVPDHFTAVPADQVFPAVFPVTVVTGGNGEGCASGSGLSRGWFCHCFVFLVAPHSLAAPPAPLLSR